MVSKEKLRKLAQFENHMAITIDFPQLVKLVKGLEAISKETSDKSILEYTEVKKRKTKPLTEQACAFLIKELIKNDPDNKDVHLDAMLNPEISEQRSYIKKNWSIVPEDVQNFKSFENSILLPNLDAESEISVRKVSATKTRDIILKLAGLSIK